MKRRKREMENLWKVIRLKLGLTAVLKAQLMGSSFQVRLILTNNTKPAIFENTVHQHIPQPIRSKDAVTLENTVDTHYGDNVLVLSQKYFDFMDRQVTQAKGKQVGKTVKQRQHQTTAAVPNASKPIAPSSHDTSSGRDSGTEGTQATQHGPGKDSDSTQQAQGPRPTLDTEEPAPGSVSSRETWAGALHYALVPNYDLYLHPLTVVQQHVSQLLGNHVELSFLPFCSSS